MVMAKAYLLVILAPFCLVGGIEPPIPNGQHNNRGALFPLYRACLTFLVQYKRKDIRMDSFLPKRTITILLDDQLALSKMSCDLSDPSIAEAYKQVLDGEVSWMLLGYMDTREKLFLYQKGDGGIDQLKEHMTDPILYALMHYKDHLVYIVYVDEKLSGVRRARTVVHGRTVASFFDQHDVHVYMNKLDNLTQDAIIQQIGTKGTNIDIPKSPRPTFAFENEVTPRTSTKTLESRESRESRETPPLPETNAKPPVIAPILNNTNGEYEEASSSPLLSMGSTNDLSNFTIRPEDHSSIRSPRGIDNGLLEVEAKRKIQEAWKNRESVRIQFDHTQGAGEAPQLSGYITVQGGGCCFWKRRWFVLRGETLYFYRDPSDKYPVSCLDLVGTDPVIEEASMDTLIPYCFRTILHKGASIEVYQFFCDSNKMKELAVAGILECSKHK